MGNSPRFVVRLKMLTALELINEIAPEHDRTTCKNDTWNRNAYFNEMGYSRCVRCALLYRIDNDGFPYNAKMICESIRDPHVVSREFN